MKSPFRTIAARLFLLLFALMLVVFSVHAYLDVRTTSSNLTDYVYTSADRASDLIVRSTRYSMLLNRKEDVHQIIKTVGSEEGFVGISIYNKSGEIIFSTDSLTIGNKVDLDAEACNICHASGEPLVSVPTEGRMRVYESASQGHILGLINPIRNEPACYTAACHAHSPEQKVLGVLDVKMSLASVDRQVAGARRQMIVSSVWMILLIAGASGLFIYRIIRKPILELKRGMTTVAEGDLDAEIEVGSRTEIGDLAEAFNHMATDLKKARGELEEWARTLEERIDQKTTELRQVQSQVVHMEKMASLGKLSASIAHEINNPLFGILTYAKLVRRELGERNVDGGSLIRKLEAIESESSRCGEIVKGLLDFARPAGGEFGDHSLNANIEQVLFLLGHHLEMRQIKVEKSLMADNDHLVCDAKQLQQAALAVCINAVESMSEEGVLTVTTTGDEKSVSVGIADTGIGIPDDVLPRIYEPFFTTKEGVQSGLGLGLSVVYGIVKRHNGTIDVQSEPGKGTVVTLTFPRNPQVTAAPGDPSAASEMERNGTNSQNESGSGTGESKGDHHVKQ